VCDLKKKKKNSEREDTTKKKFKKHREKEIIKKIEIEKKRGEKYLALRDGDRCFERGRTLL
jgi:hypothetical protein